MVRSWPVFSPPHRTSGARLAALTLVVAVAGIVARPASGEVTRGRFRGASWHIDERHVLWWNDRPSIPFHVNQLWIDRDRFRAGEAEEHRAALNRLTDLLTARGETYFVLFLTHPEVESVAELERPDIRRAFQEQWAFYAPAVAKDGLRAMTFFNEINVLRTGRDSRAADVAGTLNAYAAAMKRTVGDAPVVLKIVGDWNCEPFLEAVCGPQIDGLGGDFFSADADARLRGMMRTPVAALKRAPRTKLFWITEFSRQTGEEPRVQWPAFESRGQMERFLSLFAEAGATGFLYFPRREGSRAWQGAGGYARVTPETLAWFHELAVPVTARILAPYGPDVVEAARPPGTVPPPWSLLPEERPGAGARDAGPPDGARLGAEAAAAAARADPRVRNRLLRRFPQARLDAAYRAEYSVWEVRVRDAEAVRARVFVSDATGRVTELEEGP